MLLLLKRIFIVIIAFLLVATLFTGCLKSATLQEAIEINQNLNILLIVTNLGDNSFNDNAYNGLNQAKQDFNCKLTVLELGDNNSNLFETLDKNSASNNYDIICISSIENENGGNWLEKNASLYPDIYYIFFDASQTWVLTPPNVQYICFNQSQGDFLAGALSALETKSGVVAFIGGCNEIIIDDFLIGFLSGVKYINPDVKVFLEYTDSWADTEKGYELAKQAHQNGADIMHAVAGGAGDGVLKYCAENNIPFIGVDSDQYSVFLETNPDYADVIITSVIKDCGVALYNSVSYINQNIFMQGKVVYSLSNNGIRLAENDNYDAKVSASTKAKILNLKEQILKNTIYVPNVYQHSQDLLQSLIDKLVLTS